MPAPAEFATAKALQSNSPDNLDSALMTTNQRAVAIQVIAPDSKVVKRSGLKHQYWPR